MLTFLILGTPDCKFCLETKNLLNKHNLKFLYVDLALEFGQDWRQIFGILKSVLNNQRTIPIIGVYNNITDIIPKIDSCMFNNLDSWNLIGSYFDLEEYIQLSRHDIQPKEDISIDENY